MSNIRFAIQGVHLLKNIFFFTLIFFCAACSGAPGIKQSSPPPFKIINTTIAKGVENDLTSDAALESTDFFTNRDKKVFSRVGMINLAGAHLIRWDWYTPDGKIYQSSGNFPLKASKGMYVKECSAFHTIKLEGAEAAKLPGRWRVKIYLDDHPVAVDDFMVEEYYTSLVRKRARTILSSGGLEPVADGAGKDGHSVFGAAFIDILTANEGILDAAQLFEQLRRPVMLNADQTPEYSGIDRAGHAGGEFFFVPKKSSSKKK